MAILAQRRPNFDRAPQLQQAVQQTQTDVAADVKKIKGTVTTVEKQLEAQGKKVEGAWCTIARVLACTGVRPPLL